LIHITKDTLRQINAAAGCMDEDTGKLVTGFVGRLEMSDGLYHGEIQYADAGEGTSPETVSIQQILETGDVTNGGPQD